MTAFVGDRCAKHSVAEGASVLCGESWCVCVHGPCY